MVKSRDFNCEGIKRDEKTFDTKADGSVFTSAKEKPPIPEKFRIVVVDKILRGLGTMTGRLGAMVPAKHREGRIIPALVSWYQSQVEKRVAKAIEEYEKTRTDSNNAGGSGSANTGGTVAPEMHGCSYKTFTNGKPHSFNGTEGVVGLKRWFEKMEQVFEICKCAEDDKVKFAMCTFEGRALTWWNGNVQTLGLANANQIP
ncbi:hypothetical protein Tco_1533744 [Tanacetum coccineum]